MVLYNLRGKENKDIKERLEEGVIMVKLGQTTRGTNHGCKYLWLVKNMQVFRNYDKKACYEVLAFNRDGWSVLYRGTLVDCRKIIGNEEIVEEDIKREREEIAETKIVECAKGNDIFDGCKTVKDVMEVKQELNSRFGKDQCFDTDSVQPNKTIIAKIENNNCCPNQNTCCVVTPYVHCDYNYKSDACIKAHKKYIHYCEQVHKHIKATHNPEWHHVRLATLANIDFDMRDEKRKLVRNINQILKDGIRNLYKCENHIAYDALERYVLRKCDELIRRNHLKSFWFSYIAQQLDEVKRNTIYLYAPYITAHRNRW